jgi:hypothetical protein
MGVKVLAFADASDPDMWGADQSDIDATRRAAAADWEVVTFSDPVDLADKIMKILKDKKDSLVALEIYGHGNPSSCDGLELINVDLWADTLNRLEWNVKSSIYLSACNTGCHDPIDNGDSIAQRLSGLVPDTKARTSTIFGAKGYCRGAQACADFRTRQTVTRYDVDGNKYVPPYPPDSETAKGPKAWRGFERGQPI